MGLPIWFLKCNERLVGYDCYSAHVVAAETENIARTMVPCGCECNNYEDKHDGDHVSCTWRDPAQATAECIGVAASTEPSVVLSSFHAG